MAKSESHGIFIVARLIWRTIIVAVAIFLAWRDLSALVLYGMFGVMIAIGYFHYMTVGGWPSPKIRVPFEFAYLAWNWRLTEIRWDIPEAKQKSWWDENF